jgi:hypothetical protein
MNAATVVGWAFDADTYCTEHCDEDHYIKEPHLSQVDPPSPIFADSEWQYQPHCRECGVPLDVSVLHTSASSDDTAYFERVQDLIATAKHAFEEASDYADLIKFGPLKSQAQKELDEAL